MPLVEEKISGVDGGGVKINDEWHANSLFVAVSLMLLVTVGQCHIAVGRSMRVKINILTSQHLLLTAIMHNV